MTFDAELRDLAGRAEQAHVRSDGFASLAVRARVRRARRVYRATVAAGTMAAVVAVGAVATAVAQRWPEPVPPAETLVPTPGPTDEPILPSPTPDATDAPLVTDGVLVGWGDLGVDEAVFGGWALWESASRDGRSVVVGCDPAFEVGAASIGGFPAWYADDATGWVQATARGVTSDAGSSCLQHVAATPYGFFATGSFGLVTSDDGTSWEAVELRPAHTNGYVAAVFAVGDRVTVFVSVASLNESTVSEMWTTTDGEAWTQVTDGTAAVFDNGGPADVVAFGDRLVAVGSSPGGAYVPTAAAWVSSDGLVWERTTPEGEGFADDAMVGVVAADGGLIAVGMCTDTSQLCAWRSTDGVTWEPEEVPAEDFDSSIGFLQPGAVTTVGDDVYAVGLQYVADTDTEPRLWHRAPGGTWERLDPDVVGAVPFAQVEVAGRLVGFWPGQGWPSGGSVRVLTPLD